MLNKLKSRKFLLALFAQIAGLIIMFVPEHTNEVNQWVSTGGAFLLMALTAAGWIKAEGEVDAAREVSKSANLPLLLLAGLLALSAAGCATLNPDLTRQEVAENEWYQLRADLTSANRVYLAWSATANLNDRQTAMKVVEYGRKLQEARSALERAKTLLSQPGSKLDTLIEQVEDILIELAKPDPEIDAHDGTTSNDPGPAWRIRGHRNHQPPAAPDGERRPNHARAA